jgi:hypothetical protein
MKHRGVKIVKVKWLDAINIGKTEHSPVKPVFKTGFSVVGGTYPDSLEGCKSSIDGLIQKTMECCTVSEKEAVQLLNQTEAA